MENQGKIPGKVKAFGIIHLVFAGLGIVGTIFGLISIFTGGMGGTPEAEAIQEVMARYYNIPAVMIYHIGSMIISLALCVLLILAGIKLLKFLVAGRALSLAYAWITIAWTIIGGAANYLITNKYLTEVLYSSDLPDALMQAVEMQFKFAPVMAFCCLIYPIVILIVMLPEKYARLFPGYVPAEETDEE
ncbi:MAG: hypothetical protein JXQ27_02960 [Acidobacteria bacterium]|nr:hypothetical protein [Acidobacteriota bacterium]